MFKKFILFVFLFSLSFVSSTTCEDGCINELGGCSDYGTIQNGKYCDFVTQTFVLQKDSKEDCNNDFECKTNYSCLYGSCDNSFNPYINFFLNTTLKFCIDDNEFCFDSSARPNNSILVDASCPEEMSCYKCNSPYTWNENLSRCVPAACDESPGCLNLSSINLTVLNYSKTVDEFCSIGSCFACLSDYEWDNSSKSCVLKPCISSPGCLNQTNLTNGKLLNRSCSSGSCFICNSGYYWNSSQSLCIRSPTDSGISYSETIVLTPSEIESGSSKVVKVNDRIDFTIESTAYTLIVSSLSPSSSKINYRINPVFNNLVAVVGANNRFDLNSDGTIDVNVKLESLSGTQAVVSITKESSSVSPSNPPILNTDDDGEEESVVVPTTKNIKSSAKSGAGYFVILLLAILLVLIAIVIVAVIKKKKAAQSELDTQQNGYRTNY
jgi:hypothetical protein